LGQAPAWHGRSQGDFAPQHENIIFATKGKFRFPGKRPNSIISVSKIYPLKLKHPNEKPVDLMRQLIEAITPKGGTVLDPFMGAGSSAEAAAILGVNFIGIELEPDYVEIAK
jgi:site-specific DNA-methyltransferase (adenine-specific)